MKKLIAIMMVVIIAVTNINIVPVKKATAKSNVTASVTPSATPTVTASVTPSATPTITASITPSATPTVTASVTPSIAPVQTASAEEAGERVLYTSSDLGYGYAVKAVLSADGKTIYYWDVRVSDGRIDSQPDTNIVIGDDGFITWTSICRVERYKIIENNDYRLKVEDCYGQIYLVDESHYMAKISGDMSGTADWIKIKYELDEEIGVYKGGMLWEANGAVKVAKDCTTKIALMGSDKYVDMYHEDPLVTWTSSDSSIATIDSNGVITGKTKGTVTMTAEYPNNKPVSIKVKVVKNEYKDSITYGMNGMKVNHSDSLTHYAVTSMKWDKKGNLHCVFKKKTFKRNGKVLKKTGSRKNETLYITIYDDNEHAVCRKTVKFKNVGYYSATKKFVIKKKNLKKTNFDLVHADYSMDDSAGMDAY